jgi:hypothetical protein
MGKRVLLGELLAKADPVIVGLWRFRRFGEKHPQWCCTWRYRGNYYDTYPRKTPEAALQAMLKNWQQVKTRRQSTKKKLVGE